MQVPPNMKRKAVEYRFCFSELSLSDAEVEALCVIPTRAVRVAAAPCPEAPQAAALRPTVPRSRRARRAARAAAAAGLAFLALPACTMFPGNEVFDAAVDVVELAGAAVSMHKVMFVAADDGSGGAAPAAEATGSSSSSARGVQPRPARPPVVDRALLVRAGDLMEHGQYRAALAMYRKLIRREPTQVDALFGAALATHELREAKASNAYLTRTLALQPDHPLANVLAGFSDQLDRRYSSAREHYARYLSVEQGTEGVEEIRAVLAQLPYASGSAVAGNR